MAAGSTYEPITTTTLGSGQASVTFSSLGSYTDLVLVFNGKCTSSGGGNAFLQFNGDTATNYSSTGMYGDLTSPASFRGSNNASCGGCIVDNINVGTVIYHIMNYSNSSAYKVVIGRGNNTGQYTDIRIGSWRSNSSITSILMYSNGGNWQTGSTFTLYGIVAA
jgi:hypothetical protein